MSKYRIKSISSNFTVRSLINNKSRYSLEDFEKKVPQVVNRYGGKGKSFEDYREPIYYIATETGCTVFADLFGGAGTIALLAASLIDNNNSQIFDSIIFNDLDVGLYCIFSSLQDEDDTEDMIDNILKMEYSRYFFNKTRNIMKALNTLKLNAKKPIETDDEALLEIIELIKEKKLTHKELIDKLENNNQLKAYIAACEYIRSVTSFNGAGETYRDHSNKYYEKDRTRLIIRGCENFRKAVPFIRQADFKVYSVSALDILKQAAIEKEQGKNSNILYFLDPPYYHPTRGRNAKKIYDFELSNEDHRIMIDSLKKIDNWILCGYDIDDADNPYKELESVPGVERIDLGEKELYSRIIETEHRNNEIIWVKKTIS